MKATDQPFVAELDQLLHKLTLSTGYADSRTLQKHLKFVFQVIRERVSFEESIKFIDLLPISFKALFLDEWHIHTTSPKPLQGMDDFAQAIVQASGHMIASPTEARQLLRQVFTFFGQFASPDQMKEGLAFLPQEFHSLLMNDPSLKYSYSDTCIWLS
ncbi:MAG: DUF2267 domain-containing protein [Cyclobacteriaceae bacterium]